MSTEIVEELVIAKRMAQQQSEMLLGLVGVIVLQHGDYNKNGAVEYRLTKAKLTKIEGYGIDVRSLKTGGMVITVRKSEDT